MTRSLAALALLVFAACSDGTNTVPVRAAPASRHAELESALALEAHAYAFDAGDWLEDAGEAPFFGLGFLARRAQAGAADTDERARRDAAVVRAETLLAGDANAESVMAALGIVEYVSASGDRRPVPVLDAFLDRVDAQLAAVGNYLPDTTPGADVYGPTVLTAAIALLEAQAALYLNETQRVARVRAIDSAIVAAALGDLVDVTTGTSVRAYAFGPDRAEIHALPNAAMLILKSRLFRLTKDEAYRLESRAVYSALEDARDATALASAGYKALALLLMFEITGEQPFVDKADDVVDGIARLRGDYCTPAPARCASGLVDATTFDSGANFEALYVIGYRRMLAGERY